MSETPEADLNTTPSTETVDTNWREEGIWISKKYITFWAVLTAAGIVGTILSVLDLRAAASASDILPAWFNVISFIGGLTLIIVGSILVTRLTLNYIDVAVKKAITAKK